MPGGIVISGVPSLAPCKFFCGFRLNSFRSFWIIDFYGLLSVRQGRDKAERAGLACLFGAFCGKDFLAEVPKLRVGNEVAGKQIREILGLHGFPHVRRNKENLILKKKAVLIILK